MTHTKNIAMNTKFRLKVGVEHMIAMHRSAHLLQIPQIQGMNQFPMQKVSSRNSDNSIVL